MQAIRWFDDISAEDTAVVGGKNASLGEMIGQLQSAGIRVPDGFATTAEAYWAFVDANGLRDRVAEQIGRLHDGANLADVGHHLRDLFLAGKLPEELVRGIADAYEELGTRLGRRDPDVAVRSSATAEDLPEASFAGQQETFLNITGVDAVLDACKRCYASLFTDRAINYHEDQSFDHREVALSVGVQQMVRSDLAGAGVMFTIDTETGFPDVVVIDAAWGLGESVVSGKVDPDEYVVFKPLLDDEELTPIIEKRIGRKAHKIIYGRTTNNGDAAGQDDDPTATVETDPKEAHSPVLSDEEILTLARWGVAIEAHNDCAMDIEWAKDGNTGEVYIVQARPETVQSTRDASSLRSYRLTGSGQVLVSGLAIGDAVAAAPVCKLSSVDEIDLFVDGAVLVTGITDPDWEPVMQRAAAIVTDHGGRTSHAAIVSRELGVSAVVGTGDATTVLDNDQEVTVSCAEGDEGHVYEGFLEHEEREVDLDEIPETRTDVLLNVGEPAGALRWWRLPADGIGLARIEFIVANDIRDLGTHPLRSGHCYPSRERFVDPE